MSSTCRKLFNLLCCSIDSCVDGQRAQRGSERSECSHDSNMSWVSCVSIWISELTHELALCTLTLKQFAVWTCKGILWQNSGHCPASKASNNRQAGQRRPQALLFDIRLWSKATPDNKQSQMHGALCAVNHAGHSSLAAAKPAFQYPHQYRQTMT